MPKRSSRKQGGPDLNELASRIVGEATEGPPPELSAEATDPDEAARKAAARLLGSRGGQKGGKSRAERLSPEERSEIARKAAKARWKRRDGP